jgi:hypothetical protein
MQSKRSIHDNFVTSYIVDCEGRRITLHTVYRDREPFEYTDVVFRDVFAHRFEYGLEGNILFDVEEVDVAGIVQGEADLFAKSWRYGWPPFEYKGDLAELVRSMEAASAHAFALNSSYGLSGWVIARSFEAVAKITDAPDGV